MATRDENMSQKLSRLSFHAAQFGDEVSRWRDEAGLEGAEAHYRLYDRISNELHEASTHIDCAATLVDPQQTDVATFEEKS